MKTPLNYPQLMPYLMVNNAYDFMAFMKTVFGATEQLIVPRSEGIIMYGELRIGQAVIMFADATAEFKPFPGSIFIYVDDADKVFEKALSEGATMLQELENREYGRGGGFQDIFGNQWWVNTAI